MLVEAAWSYCHRPYRTAALNRRSEGQPPEVLACWWTAQLRLTPLAGILPQKATTTSRSSPRHKSFVGFLWRLMTGKDPRQTRQRVSVELGRILGKLCADPFALSVRGRLRRNDDVQFRSA